LLRSASQYDKPDNNLGYGIPNFSKAYLGEILSVESQEIMDFKLYPNPLSSTELSLDFGMETELDLKVFDVSGRKVAEERLFRTTKSEPYRVGLPNLQPGLYLLQLTDGNRVYRTKLLKK
jgi:hypothetical protein